MAISFINRLGKYFIRIHSRAKPFSCSAMVNAKSFTERRKASRDAKGCNDSVQPGVSLLLFSCGPLHISGLIAKRIINAFNGQTWMRRHTNVFKKVCESSPSFTNKNPTTAVILKLFVLRVYASLNHIRPSNVGFALKSSPVVGVIGGRHNVRLSISNVVFSCGRSATTGAHGAIMPISGICST